MGLLSVIGLGVALLVFAGSGKAALPDADLDEILTEEIYAACRAAGLDPELEMRRLTESTVYPLEIVAAPSIELGIQKGLLTFRNGTPHYNRCMCAECQVDRLPPEERTNIFVEENLYGEKSPCAHYRYCLCDRCRSKSGIDAERLLELSRMPSSSMESLSALATNDRCLELWRHWSASHPSRAN